MVKFRRRRTVKLIGSAQGEMSARIIVAETASRMDDLDQSSSGPHRYVSAHHQEMGEVFMEHLNAPDKRVAGDYMASMDADVQHNIRIYAIRRFAIDEKWQKIQDVLSADNLMKEDKIKYVQEIKEIEESFRENANPNVFQWAIGKSAPDSFIQYLLIMGGEDGAYQLLESKDTHGANGLDWAFYYGCNLTLETLESMKKTGGDLIHAEDRHKTTIFHSLCKATNPTPEVIDLLTGNIPPEKGTPKAHQIQKEMTMKFIQGKNEQDDYPIDYLLRKLGKGFDYGRVPLDAVLHLLNIFYLNDKYAQHIPSEISDTLLDFAKNMPGSKRDDILDGHFMKALLNKKAIEPFTIGVMFVEFIMQIFLVISFSFLTKKDESISTMTTTLLSIALSWLCIREVPQLLSGSIFQYVNDESNWLDAVQIVLICVTLFGYQGNPDLTLLILSILFSWLRLVFVIGNMRYDISVFTSTLMKIIYQLVPFIFVTTIIVMAFSHSFHAIGPPEGINCPLKTNNVTHWDEGGWACSLSNSYFESFVMVLSGGWVYLDDLDGRHTLLSMTFAFIVGILLLNIIIAQLSNVFTEVQSNSAKAFWENRLRFIADLKSLKYMLKPLLWLLGPLVSRPTNEGDEPIKVNWLHKMSVDRGLVSVYDPLFSKETNINIPDEERDRKLPDQLQKCLSWFYQHDSQKEGDGYPLPSLRERIVFILAVFEWQEMFPPSRECCKILIKETYFSGEDKNKKASPKAAFCQILKLWLAGFIFSLFCIVVFPIVFALGLITCGYFWPKELKRSLFWGTTDVVMSEISSEVDKIRMEVIDSQKKVKERISNLEQKTDKILELLKEMHSKQYVVDAVLNPLLDKATDGNKKD